MTDRLTGGSEESQIQICCRRRLFVRRCLLAELGRIS